MPGTWVWLVGVGAVSAMELLDSWPVWRPSQQASGATDAYARYASVAGDVEFGLATVVRLILRIYSGGGQPPTPAALVRIVEGPTLPETPRGSRAVARPVRSGRKRPPGRRRRGR